MTSLTIHIDRFNGAQNLSDLQAGAKISEKARFNLTYKAGLCSDGGQLLHSKDFFDRWFVLMGVEQFRNEMLGEKT